MTIVALFLVSAGLSFALSLVLAGLLGPIGFGRYALALSVAVVINTLVFEWLRLSATRFYSERVRAGDPGVRRSLDRGYAVSAIGLAALGALGWAAGFDLGLSGALLAGALAMGLTLGLFDYAAALARARFLDRAYAGLVLVRALAGFGLAAGAAWLWGEPALVLAGSSLAALAALLLARAALRDPDQAAAPFETTRLRMFARYAVPLVAASAVYQLLPAFNRAVLASRDGFAEAGYFSLASEIGMRLFQNLGSALDLVLFQLAVRADETHGRAHAERQIGRNIAIVAAILWPASVGFWVVLPSFEATFVPASFRGQFIPAMELLIPALAAFALIQYGLNPVFQLRARTSPVIAAAALALVLDVALVLFWPGLSGPRGFAAAQLASLAGSLLLLGGAAVRASARLPWRDLGLSAAAAGAMGALVWPLRGLGPSSAALLLQVSAGALAYGVLALALDIAGTRGLVRRLRTKIGA